LRERDTMSSDHEPDHGDNLGKRKKKRGFEGSEEQWLELLEQIAKDQSDDSYRLYPEDYMLVDAVRNFLRHIIKSPRYVNPGVLEVAARLLGIFQRLPLVSPDTSDSLTIWLTNERRVDEEDRADEEVGEEEEEARYLEDISEFAVTIKVDGSTIAVRETGSSHGAFGFGGFNRANWEITPGIENDGFTFEDYALMHSMTEKDSEILEDINVMKWVEENVEPLACMLEEAQLNDWVANITARLRGAVLLATDPAMPEYRPTEKDYDEAQGRFIPDPIPAPPETVIPPLSETARQLIDIFGVDWIPTAKEEEKKRRE
jgi:hypothetical protein